MHRHRFVPYGGARENPGVFDLGGGRMLFRAVCECGRVRERVTDVRPRPSSYADPDRVRYHGGGLRPAARGVCP